MTAKNTSSRGAGAAAARSRWSENSYLFTREMGRRSFVALARYLAAQCVQARLGVGKRP